MASDILLTIERVDVLRGTAQALWDVSLEVRRGEKVALIGPNTAGKTTVLDTISGLLHPTQGRITYQGIDISRWEPYRIVELGITHVPEGRRVFSDMTVLDNLLIGSYVQAARPKRRESLDRVYGLFPRLAERRRQIAKTLSGGEQQMLAIGRGLMADPKLMLIDEMTLGLAPVVAEELFEALRLIRDRGVGILFVEQNVHRSLREADRVHIIERGRIVLSGAPGDLRDMDEVKKAYFGVDAEEDPWSRRAIR